MTLQKDQPKKPWYKRIIEVHPREKPDKKGSNRWIILAIIVAAVILVGAMITWGIRSGVRWF